MAKPLPELLTHLLEDLLEGDSNYTVKMMFGGYSIYYKGQIFAIYGWDTLFMKVGENNIQDYKDAGAKQFEFEKKNGRIYRMCYWQLPEEILEDKEKLMEWIDKSLAVTKK